MPVFIGGKAVGSINNTLERHEESIDTIDRGKVDSDNLMLLDVISGLVMTQPVTTTHTDVMRTSGVYAMGEYLNRS